MTCQEGLDAMEKTIVLIFILKTTVSYNGLCWPNLQIGTVHAGNKHESNGQAKSSRVDMKGGEHRNLGLFSRLSLNRVGA